MKTSHWLAGILALAVLSTQIEAQTYLEDFESYSVNSNIVGQGGWREFNGAPPALSLVSSNFANSGTKSLRTSTGSNTIREWTNFNSGTGKWVVTCQSYIPSTTTEEFWFKFMSFYRDNGPYFWVSQVGFNAGAAGMGRCFSGTLTATSFTVIYDRWVEIKLLIDLDADTIEVFYDGTSLVAPFSFTRGYQGVGTGPKMFAAIELHHLSSSNGQLAYWDDILIERNFPKPIFFCTAKSAVVCGPPSIGYSGVPSVSAPNGFVVSAGPARSCKSGIFLYNTSTQSPPVPFQGGSLCTAASGLKRAGGTNSQGTPGAANCDGAFSIDILEFAKLAWAVPDCAGNPTGAVQNNPAPFLLNLGQTVYGQYWGRDSTTTGSFVSDAIAWLTIP
jgi:hypothetical protein